MALDVTALESEVRAVAGALSLSWDDLATYAKGKMIECAVNGGVTSYTINNRTVTKDIRWWQDLHKFAKAQSAAEDDGGICGQQISFRAPRGRSIL